MISLPSFGILLEETQFGASRTSNLNGHCNNVKFEIEL